MSGIMLIVSLTLTYKTMIYKYNAPAQSRKTMVIVLIFSKNISINQIILEIGKWFLFLTNRVKKAYIKWEIK